jgi:hypothetical protein
MVTSFVSQHHYTAGVFGPTGRLDTTVVMSILPSSDAAAQQLPPLQQEEQEWSTYHL